MGTANKPQSSSSSIRPSPATMIYCRTRTGTLFLGRKQRNPSERKPPALKQTTIDSFRKANSQQASVHLSIRSPIDYELVTSAQLEPIFCKHCGFWPEYYKRFPGASGIVTWSRVGFNSDGTQALFYESYRCGDLCGTGRYMVMEEKNGSWMIGSDIVVWVS